MKRWKTRERLFCIKIKSPDILLHIYDIWPVRHEFIYKPIFLWSMLTFVWCVLIRRLLVGILLGMILCNAAETFLMICISKIMFQHSFSPCMKSVQMRSYFWSVFSCIQPKYRKIRTRKNYVFGHFSLRVCFTFFSDQSDNEVLSKYFKKWCWWCWCEEIYRYLRICSNLQKISSKTSFPEQERNVQWY